jgi:hypothetical protein
LSEVCKSHSCLIGKPSAPQVLTGREMILIFEVVDDFEKHRDAVANNQLIAHDESPRTARIGASTTVGQYTSTSVTPQLLGQEHGDGSLFDTWVVSRRSQSCNAMYVYSFIIPSWESSDRTNLPNASQCLHKPLDSTSQYPSTLSHHQQGFYSPCPHRPSHPQGD